MKRSIRIDLLGTSFTIQSDEDPAYLRNLVGYYRDKLTEVRQSVSTNDDLKIAILGALTVVDELFKERHRHGDSGKPTGEAVSVSHDTASGDEASNTSSDLSALADRLIKRLDNVLDDNNQSDDTGDNTEQ